MTEDDEKPKYFNPPYCSESRINVCLGSTPTLLTSLVSEQDIQEQEENTEECVCDSCSTSSEESDSLIDWGSDSTWPDIHLPGSWGTEAIEETPWDNKRNPYSSFRTYKDLQLNEIESKGILTDRIIAVSSSYLDRAPETQKYVLCKVDLSRKALKDIHIIAYHHYLQYVDLSWNGLTDVEALGQLPFLMYLDLSHNFLTKVLNFKPPFNLTYVNYSSNTIEEIDDLTSFWSMVFLDLSHNYISLIKGIESLKYLRHLNLSHNSIKCIENLNNMKLLTLDLQHNSITKFEEKNEGGFKTLIDILRVNLADNYLSTLKLFQGVTAIQSINVAHNCLEDLMEITYLRGLNFLSEVDFRGNPIATAKHYLEVCLNTMKFVTALDGELVDTSQKVLVKEKFETSPYLKAFQKSSKMVFLEQINDPILGSSTVPADHQSPPIIVLVGPPGSNKGKLVQSFWKKHPRFTVLGVSHTTREKNVDEVENETYHFITAPTFKKMVHKSEFLTASSTLGHYFAFAQNEICKVLGKSVVLVLHMDLIGALTLRRKGFQCYLVLAMTSTADSHRQWLREKYCNWQDAARYTGAIQMENCPIKAQEFLKECDKFSKANLNEMVGEIVTDLVYNATSTNSETNIESERSDDYFLDRSNVSMKISGSKGSHTLGILKSPSSKCKALSPSASQHPRVSVTFQSSETDNFDKIHVQPCRSVTFSDVPSTGVSSTSEIALPLHSVSGTVVHGRALEGVVLSVLSRSYISERTEGVTPNSVTWRMQTEALEVFVDEIIESRDTYLHAHFSNPGLFSEVIFTDDFEDALNKLKQLLKRCMKRQPKSPQHYQYKRDTVYQVMVASRLESLHKEINSQMSITEKQMNCMSEGIIPNSFKSDLKVYEDEVIDAMSKKHEQSVTYKLPKESVDVHGGKHQACQTGNGSKKSLITVSLVPKY